MTVFHATTQRREAERDFLKIINLLNFIKIKICHEFLFVAHVASLRESHAFLDIESSNEPSLPFSRTAELGLMFWSRRVGQAFRLSPRTSRLPVEPGALRGQAEGLSYTPATAG
jgi:hypothetical protein